MARRTGLAMTCWLPRRVMHEIEKFLNAQSEWTKTELVVVSMYHFLAERSLAEQLQSLANYRGSNWV